MFGNRTDTENEDAASLLYSSLVSGAGVTIFISMYLVFNFQSPQTLSFKLIWISLLFFITLIRLGDYLYWKRSHTDRHYRPKKAILRYITGTLLTVFMLAFYCVYMFRYSNDIETSVIILTLSALAGGAASVLSANKLIAILYPVILILPASIALYLSPSEYQNNFGVLGFIFCTVMVGVASKAADFTSQAIALKNENIDLINHMEEKVSRRTETIYQLSNIDPLTGLYNRSAFMQKLAQQLKRCKSNNSSLALLFIDLDGFKKINDTLGHRFGDELLKRTATRIEQYLVDKQLVCRWGGDEFLVACIDTDEQQALDYATKLIEHISLPYNFENSNLSIGATTGIALFPKHAQLADLLIQYADTAMYVQKKAQPNIARCFDQAMGEQIQREHLLKVNLAGAISNNQLRMVYQPIVNAQTEAVVAFEALLRWKLNDKEISPAEFIGIAEQHGLINSIGNWVLQQSCATAATWCGGNQSLSPQVSVNVSILQFNNDDFIEVVNSALSDSKLSSDKLIVEITESIFAENKQKVLQHVRQLQAIGVKVSIDDFGSEYSSLSVVQNLAADTIKIDREFIMSIDNGGLAIIEAVKEIADKLNYSVIAEGVETYEQAGLLKNLGIDMLQGYYYSKPMEADLVDAYLASTTVISQNTKLEARS